MIFSTVRQRIQPSATICEQKYAIAQITSLSDCHAVRKFELLVIVTRGQTDMDDNNPKLSLSDRFSRAAQWTSQQCGRAYTFVAAIVIIMVWAVSGPAFNYSDTWQLIINTGTTIITFLMVFLIQNTQNRDTTAIQLKLDELIRANENARDQMLRLEDLTENQIKHLKESFAVTGPSRPSGNHWKLPNRDLPRLPKISRRQKVACPDTAQASGEGHDPFSAALKPALDISRRQLANMTNDMAVPVWLRHKSALLGKCLVIRAAAGPT